MDKFSIIWAIVVGIITDSMGIKKVRIAKGKIKGKVFKDKKGKLQYDIYDKDDPITQVNRLNIKTVEEWNKVKKLVDKHMAKLK